MGETSDGQAGSSAAQPEDADPDSPARSFFARIFGRDSSDQDEPPDAAGGGRPRGPRLSLRNLRRMRVDDVSVPRADIVAIPEDATLEDVVAVFHESTLSRLPVYSETLDQPLGLVHLKDLALTCGFGAPAGAFDLKGLIHPLLYAPPSMPIWVLLQKMQAARIHMALVIDEYGGVDGLVTIEDVLEQIVGDIADEHDEAESQLWSEEAPGVLLAEARMDLDALEGVAGLRLAPPELAEEVDTLGGLVIRLAGRVPARGEVVPHPEGPEFEVVDADARRINRVRVRLAPADRAPAEAAE
ncbi:MAG TPA: hemolysin family protein [Amaricoccus sp.]|jgi:magnesium and cobalt transporter|nr:hemolysin family protein [Amaricoccus sp.]